MSIGEALALRGAAVALGGRTVRNEAADTLRSRGGSVLCGHLDVRDTSSVQNFVNNVQSMLGPIDILINSAGVNISKSFDNLTNNDWKAIYDINVFGLVNVTRHVVPIMKRSQYVGKIVNIASIKGLYSSVGRVAYASSKAAVINLTTGLAKELAPKVLVNACLLYTSPSPRDRG